MGKMFNSRTQQKHDVEENWKKAIGFTPLDGEIIVYDPDDVYDYPRIKVGDGESNVNDLPFVLDGNADSATKLETAKAIDGVEFDGSSDISHYGICSTAASTTAKTVTCEGFKLVTGARITVKFNYTNSASSPTLNVNNTGDKSIRWAGSASLDSYLKAYEVYEFVYDGTYYQLIGNRTDSYINSTSTNPVQNKVVYTQLQNKAPLVHTHKYEDLDNKPFGDTTITEMIYDPASLEGLDSLYYNSDWGTFYKISDKALTIEQMREVIVYASSSGSLTNWMNFGSFRTLSNWGDDCICAEGCGGTGSICCISASTTKWGASSIIAPSAGTYLSGGISPYYSYKLVFEDNTIDTIDAKYLPTDGTEPYALKDHTHTASATEVIVSCYCNQIQNNPSVTIQNNPSGIPNGTYYKISDEVFTYQEVSSGSCLFRDEGQEWSRSSSLYDLNNFDGIIYFRLPSSSEWLIVSKTNWGGGVTFPSTGVYMHPTTTYDGYQEGISCTTTRYPVIAPSPYNLIINGQSYNGSKEVDMTEAINALIDAKLEVIENGTY